MIFKTMQSPPYMRETLTYQILETTCPLCHQHVRFTLNPEDAKQYKEDAEHWRKEATYWKKGYSELKKYMDLIVQSTRQ